MSPNTRIARPVRLRILIGLWMLAGTACTPDLGGTDREQAPGSTAGTSIPAEPNDVVNVALHNAPAVKHFPEPARGPSSQSNRADCEKAGGEWLDAYRSGMFLSRTATPGSRPIGKVCWSPPPARLADAGKPCRGQADCIGNCLAVRTSDGSLSGAACQADTTSPNCEYISDGGGLFRTACYVP